MNDFTKEELQEIKRCVKYMIKGGTTPYSCFTVEINKKLQLMIDKYCKHEEVEMDCDGGISLVCSNCGYVAMDV